MEALANPYVIAGLMAAAVGLLMYAFFVPRENDSFSPSVVSEEDRKKDLLYYTSMLGSELYSTLPAGVMKKGRKDARTEELLVHAGNPWKLTVDEFKFMKLVCLFAGLLAGIGVWFALSFAMELPWWAVVAVCGLFGYRTPVMKYQSIAKQRDLDFKRQLPEALDLIIISLSGGSTFINSLRSALVNMRDGVLKDEFTTVLRNVDSGKTVNESLELFADRAPNESIYTFVQAVKQANELDTPMIGVLRSRAEESREEYFSLVHSKTASLSSKMYAVLTPTLIPALLIIVVAPSIASLVENL